MPQELATYIYKQLLNEVFVISRIINVELLGLSAERNQSLQLITLSETLIMLDIAKTESNNVSLLIIL